MLLVLNMIIIAFKNPHTLILENFNEIRARLKAFTNHRQHIKSIKANCPYNLSNKSVNMFIHNPGDKNRVWPLRGDAIVCTLDSATGITCHMLLELTAIVIKAQTQAHSKRGNPLVPDSDDVQAKKNQHHIHSFYS